MVLIDSFFLSIKAMDASRSGWEGHKRNMQAFFVPIAELLYNLLGETTSYTPLKR